MREEPGKPKANLMSFGFKYGLPHANYYFDVGFVKNPARLDKWDFFSPPNEEMRRYLLEQEEAVEFLDLVEPLVAYLSSIDQKQVFAFGCSAGRHRSSILVEELSRRLEQSGIETTVYHRDENA